AMVAASLLAPSPSVASGIWDDWYKKTKQSCPDHHLELLAGYDYDELPDSFISTFPATTQKAILKTANYSRRCAQETMGFYCEMAVDLDAFKKMGLLNSFVAFACASRKCTEAATCTRSGRS